MSVPGTMDLLEEKCLRAVYELAGRKAVNAISLAKVRRALGRSKGDVEQACHFWASRGILEWAGCYQIALTPVGLRRADHLEKIRWQPSSPSYAASGDNRAATLATPLDMAS